MKENENKSRISEILKGYNLTERQVDEIANLVIEYSAMNSEVIAAVPHICPKCGAYEPGITRGGLTSTGKQMYRCKCCGKRFTATNGHLMHHSHMDSSSWIRVIVDTIGGKPLKSTARGMSSSIVTAFRMRHKLLRFLEDWMQQVSLREYIEADETFVNLNGKRKPEGIWQEMRKDPRRKGISGMACIACAVEPRGRAYCGCYNYGPIGSADTCEFLSHVERRAVLVVDGHNSYMGASKSLGLDRIAVDGKDEASRHNLNAVNSFHSQIKALIRAYRGISVKYVNRYCALFSLRWNIKEKTEHEILSAVNLIIHDHRIHETYETVLKHNLWNPIAS